MRLGLSDEALKREATEAARGSRRERHLKVLERRQEQQQRAKEEAEGAKKEAQSHARASRKAANARAEAAAAALLAEEYGSAQSIAGQKSKVSKAKTGIAAGPGSPAPQPSQARKAAAKAARHGTLWGDNKGVDEVEDYRPSLITEVCFRVYRIIGCVGACALSLGNLRMLAACISVSQSQFHGATPCGRVQV
jgi:hypothetical protein